MIAHIERSRCQNNIEDTPPLGTIPPDNFRVHLIMLDTSSIYLDQLKGTKTCVALQDCLKNIREKKGVASTKPAGSDDGKLQLQ